MSSKMSAAGGGALLLRAAFFWLLSALLLACAAALLLSRLSVSSAALGYVSSLISFVSAAAAGSACRSKPGEKPLLQVFLVGLFLVILLLTVGFLVRGEKMNPSAVLSLVSFTLSGAAAGGLLFSGRRRKKGRGKRRRTFAVR